MGLEHGRVSLEQQDVIFRYESHRGSALDNLTKLLTFGKFGFEVPVIIISKIDTLNPLAKEVLIDLHISNEVILGRFIRNSKTPQRQSR